MAMLLLLSTTSFTISKHFCMGSLVDVALFSEADTCGMDMVSDMEQNTPDLKSTCCSDEKIVLQGQDDLSSGYDQISLDQQYFIQTFIVSWLQVFEEANKEPETFKFYTPPRLVTDISVMYATFLI
ncbi:hypothetical protein DMZ48_15370 [Robertkochia solimangrovi]|nr:hypothetical protein DMZ48_15370 [Robertkochia solimangrovi]